jgi:diguanylate cyclase (GGDEF)-like protein
MSLWMDFFEEMDELVYISDPVTYEIHYMNKLLRESLGYQEAKEYVGKKCYEVLQGYKQPCSFCTNPILEPGKFISWTYKNPVLNKRFMIKDTLMEYLGHRYRVEIAIDIDSEVACNTPYYYARSESILNDCLQQIFSTTDPEWSLNKVLSYLGKTFACDRAFIFEFGEKAANNTYEWCSADVPPQKEILQNLSFSSIDWWLDLFQENEVVTIQNLEDIRTEHPITYAILKPQNINSLIAGPISIEGKVVGFLGVDNPNQETMSLIGPLLKVLGYFIVALLRRRDLLNHLHTLSFHDPLTGAYNRNAMFEHSKKFQNLDCVGMVYCDITGLKHTNDTLGHNAGDQLIQYCFDALRLTLDTPWLYRIGGDEFVAVFQDIKKEAFLEQVDSLQKYISQAKHHMAVGYAWSDKPPHDLENLIIQADKIMYQDKRNYYAAYHRIPGIDRRNPEQDLPVPSDSIFNHFLQTTYYDMELLFQSISQQNSTAYFYFGDLQKDLFYISDNMRDEFGFQSNIVPGLLQVWAQRIPSEKARELYRNELNSMLEEKRSIHDLRYQVRNIHGKNMWVRCYGILKWSDDGTTPLFFSGRVTHQDDNFVVDPVTNFPREAALFSRLDEAKGNHQSVRTIGFSFNNIAEINSTRGRIFSDHLVQTITENLMESLSDRVSFYRLDGMCCVAIIDPSCKDSKEKLVDQIREIITRWYRIMGISVPHPCSFALMEYPISHLMPADFAEELVSFIRIAKHDPSQNYVEYSEKNIQKAKRISNMALALSRDVLYGMQNFRIVVQPVISVEDNSIVGGETLLRWSFQGKDVSPEVFIPMLEKDNMIHLAGRWVFEQAVCTCMRLISYSPNFYLTFNVSLHQMSDKHFCEFMEETLEKYNLDGTHLIAEMTESCLDEQPEKLLYFLNNCNKLGIRIALDDFGSGYSSLRMMLQYPSSVIKLDRSLLGEMTESVDKMNFISSIVYACHRFGKKVCMEGVETDEQDALIRESGCDLIQGYRYYRPMEISALYRLLADNKKRPL